jgi:hypothetical protein
MFKKFQSPSFDDFLPSDIRLRQIGKNSYNHDDLLLSGFEIFGILREG